MHIVMRTHTHTHAQDTKQTNSITAMAETAEMEEEKEEGEEEIEIAIMWLSHVHENRDRGDIGRHQCISSISSFDSALLYVNQGMSNGSGNSSSTVEGHSPIL